MSGKKKPVLTKAAILDAKDLRAVRVHVPEWGGDVYVRPMTGAERDAFEQSMFNGKGEVDSRNARARIAVLTVVDENGERLFTDDDIELVGAKSGHALDRVFTRSRKLSGLTAEDMDDLSKNS